MLRNEFIMNLNRIYYCINFKYFRKYSTSFVTTPIFYVNGSPHIGHLYSALIADAYYRFQCLKNSRKNVIFSTGTDEHGQKIQLAAGSINSSEIKQYCDKVASRYKDLFDRCGINYSHFVRTTDSNHRTSVEAFWNTLNSNGFIYAGKYSGWYCVSDEMFISKTQLKTSTNKNGNEIKISALSGHPVEWNSEENFMFQLSKVKPDLLYWLKDETKVVPSKFNKILLSWLHEDDDLSNISISRPSHRIPWGIPVPNHPSQTIYVWLDALVNYLTVAGYPNLKTWPPSVQIIGKDILKFHGIYWPAFLIAAGLEPPEKLFVHSHWTVDDEKMSKSKNNVIDPFEKIKMYTVSGFRYFLLKEGVPHSDGNYCEFKVAEMVNADLANTLGNLLNRCVSNSVNYLQMYPAFNKSEFNVMLNEYDVLKILSEDMCNLQYSVTKHYEELNFYRGIQDVMKVLHLGNKLFDECKPWKMTKNVSDAQKLSCVLHITMEVLRLCGIALTPIVPYISSRLFEKLNVPQTMIDWGSMVPSWNNSSYSEKINYLNSDNIILCRKIVTK